MYESPTQKEPVYDAKGIETVRRDGCPAVAKVRVLVSVLKQQCRRMFGGIRNFAEFSEYSF